MVELRRHGSEVASVFDLLGTDENDLTSALGFTMARCPQLCEAIAARIGVGGGDAVIAMEVRHAEGRTDLELRVGQDLFVFEAKAGWLLPGVEQLARYTSSIRGNGALITLSQASRALAAHRLPPEVNGVPVFHLPWREVLDDIREVEPRCRGRERMWLQELNQYLKGVVRMVDVADSWAYCVALNDERPGDGPISFKEFVQEHGTYFHPFGTGGWPLEPANFLAFRWEGWLREVHRVIGTEVIADLSDLYRWMADYPEAHRPHMIYTLGPALRFEPIPNGTTYRARRFKVLLDQLLTASTLYEAETASRLLAKNI